MENVSQVSTGKVRVGVSRLFQALSIADRLTVTYLALVIILVLARHEHVRYWLAITLIHLLLILAISVLSHFRSRTGSFLALASHWYPVLLFGFFFEEIGFIVHAIHAGWFDRLLINADLAIFGVHPTVWIEQFHSYWLTEFLQLSYTSYLLLTIGLGVYFWRRRQGEAFEVLIVSSCISYYIGYLIFVLFPIESPYHTLRHLQTVDLVGGPFSAVINWIERYGRVHGGAFPSAHVSGSVVALICAWRYVPRISKWMTPLVVSICVATVYGRYHYVVDIFGGIVTAAIGCGVGLKIVRREPPRNPFTPSPRVTHLD